jgi:hypothetical protein
MTRTGKTYIIQTDDGAGYQDVFLSWNSEYGYYTTVDYLNEINEFDFYDTVAEAISRAKDANSGTFGGWQAPMKIMELLNFDAAYNDGEDPELIEVQTITF